MDQVNIKIQQGVKMDRANIEIQPKIFGIGLDRTGTTSLAAALNQLGVPTLHYANDPKTQQELFNGSRLTILEKYQGAIHGTSPFYRNLDILYPGSKFILTIRDKKQWLESMKKLGEVILDKLSWLEEEDIQRQFIKTIYELRYGSLEYKSEKYWQAYTRHQKNVREYFENRPSDLLVFNICAGEDWKKLCPFLNVPIPRTAFPYEHTGQSLAAWHHFCN